MRSIFHFIAKEKVDKLLSCLPNIHPPVAQVGEFKIRIPHHGEFCAHKLYLRLNMMDPIEQLTLSLILFGVGYGCEQVVYLYHNPPWRGLVECVFYNEVFKNLRSNAYKLSRSIPYGWCKEAKELVDRGILPSLEEKPILNALLDYYFELLNTYNPEFVEHYLYYLPKFIKHYNLS